MPRIFLQTSCTPNGPSEFSRTVTEWDTLTRAEVSTTTSTLACQTYMLATGALVDRWCELDGTRVSVYFQAGDSYVPGQAALTGQTTEAQHPACPLPGSLTLGRPVVVAASDINSADGTISVPFSTPNPPVRGVVSGQVATSAAGTGTLDFVGLPPGTYQLRVEDSAAPTPAQAYLPAVTVGAGAGAGNTIVREWLRYTITEVLDPNPPDPFYASTFNLLEGTYWDSVSKTVQPATFDVTSDAAYPAPPASYTRPLALLVDAYYLSGGVVYRQVYHRDDDGDGQGDGDVRFVDTIPPDLPLRTGLQLDNLILQHVHQPATGPRGPATGRVLAEAHSSAPGPLTFTRVATGETNATGAFSGLPAGEHRLRVQDAAGNTVETSFVIEDRYRLRWYVDTYAPDGSAVRVDIFGRDYDGLPTRLDIAGPQGLERSWETAGQDLQGVLPEAQGQACRLTVRQQWAGQFEAVFLGDDRAFRLDVRVANLLRFRGYIAPDLYDEDLSLESGGEITFTAGDGLGSLRDTVFLNHETRPLFGRRPLLSTLLHCLSRCEAGPLPLYVQTDLREIDQPAGTDWLPTFFSDRAGYAATDSEARPWTCREVIEALLRPAHAVLVQREGAWWVVSANAAGTAAPFFAYSPAGEPLSVPVPPAPLLLKPATYTTGNLFWLDAAQRAQTLAAARAVQVSTRLRLVKNQLPDGLLQAWQPDLLRPLGWEGTLVGERLDTVAGEDAKPLAGRTKLRTAAYQPAGASLLSPAIPFRSGVNESPVRVALRLRVRPTPAYTRDILTEGIFMLADEVGSYTLNGAPGYYRYKKPAGGTYALPTGPDDANWQQVNRPLDERTARLEVRFVYNGGTPNTFLRWEVGSKEKEVTVEGFLPFGAALLPGRVQLQLLAPVYADALPDGAAVVDIYEVTLQVLPAAVEWPDTDEITALNETGFLVLPAVELHHADTPRLPLSDGTLRPVPTMDAMAWQHVLTYADGAPTTRWRRTDSLGAAPLLETAGLDRLALRRVPALVFSGPVRGAALAGLGFGALVDCPLDAPGVRFWCVGATLRDLEGRAEVALREIAPADPEPLPLNRLLTHTGAALFTEEGFCLTYS